MTVRTEQFFTSKEIQNDSRLAGVCVLMTKEVAALNTQSLRRFIETLSVFNDFQTATQGNVQCMLGRWNLDGQTVAFVIEPHDVERPGHSTCNSVGDVPRVVITLRHVTKR